MMMRAGLDRINTVMATAAELEMQGEMPLNVIRRGLAYNLDLIASDCTSRGDTDTAGRATDLVRMLRAAMEQTGTGERQ